MMSSNVPQYAKNAFQSQNQGGLSSLFGSGFGSSLGQFLGGLFGDSGAHYGDAMKQFEKYFGQAQQYQKPFYDAGTGAIGNYQDWLKKMQDPTAFINKTMGGYQESPWAQNLQRQSMNATQNAASASGMLGSTPLMQQMQQNAQDLSSKDQQQWLQNVLGINSQYGAGQGNLINVGQGAANNMSNMMSQLAQLMGQGAYGQKAGQNQDFWNMISGGIGGLFGL